MTFRTLALFLSLFAFGAQVMLDADTAFVRVYPAQASVSTQGSVPSSSDQPVSDADSEQPLVQAPLAHVAALPLNVTLTPFSQWSALQGPTLIPYSGPTAPPAHRPPIA